MNKKLAYTFAEVLVCLVLVGFLFTLTASNLKTDKFNQKARIANLYKSVAAVQEASSKIRDLEPTICPTGSFMERVGLDDADYTVAISTGVSGETLDSQKLANIYAKWLKYEIKNLDYCTYSKFCESESGGGGRGAAKPKVYGGRLAGGAFVGFEYTGIIDCPAYKNLKDVSEAQDAAAVAALPDVPSRGKCWARLYVDVNGKKAPDKLNDDVFIFGLDSQGVAQ